MGWGSSWTWEDFSRERRDDPHSESICHSDRDPSEVAVHRNQRAEGSITAETTHTESNQRSPGLISWVMTSTLRILAEGSEGSSHWGHWGDCSKANRGRKSITLEGGGALQLENLWLIIFGENHLSPLSQKVHNAKLRVLFWATDLIQHLWQNQDKMEVHSHDDLLLSLLFPSSLKGATYNWFYSLPWHSLQSFEEVN